jgi:hypothetical protein
MDGTTCSKANFGIIIYDLIGQRMLFKASVLDNSMSSGLKEAFWNSLFNYFGKMPQTTGSFRYMH